MHAMMLRRYGFKIFYATIVYNRHYTHLLILILVVSTASAKAIHKSFQRLF